MSKKEQLDVVIPYIDTRSEFKELKYALRSLANLKLENTKIRVVIVGQLPPFINPEKVKHIAIDRVDGVPKTNCYDAGRKMNAVILDPEVSENVLVMYDDTYIMKETNMEDLAIGLKNKKPAELNLKKVHAQLLDATYKALEKAGKPTENCETHTPRLINKNLMVETFKKYYPIKNRLLYFTLYFNEKHETGAFKTIAKNNKHKIGFYGEVNDWSYSADLPVNELVEKISKYRFMNHDDAGLTPQLKEALEILFPEKSEYEL